MMMRLCALLMFLPIALHAQSEPIRSGEHEAFSRLVVPISPDAEWGFAATPTGYIFAVSPSEVPLDPSEIIDRLPRGRLAEVGLTSDGGLALDIACSCHVDAFLWRPDRVVIDIVDGPHPEGLTLPPLPAEIQETEQAELAPVPDPVLPNLLSLERAPVEGFPLDAPLAQEQPATAPGLAATEAALIESLARAATQGFLTANLPIRPEPTSPPPATARPDEQGAVPLATGPRAPGVGISTAMDRDLSIVRDLLNAEVEPTCLADDLYDVSAWAGEGAFHDQVAAHLNALVGEFGQDTLSAEDDLARLLVHFGFGLEARQVLATDPAQSQSRSILWELAGIVDQEEGPYPVTRSQAGCATPGGMWAFLIAPAELAAEGRNVVLQQFFLLEQPLRTQLAPRLAEAFISIEDADRAERVLGATRNQDNAMAHAVQVNRARLAETQDDPASALALLEAEARTNARTTPASAIRLTELKLELGEIPSEADVLLISSLRQEYRNDPVVADLEIAEARANIAQMKFAAALTLLNDRSDASALRVHDEAFRALANADAEVFLPLAFANLPEGVSAETENALARRLLELGFAERAQSILSTPAQREAAAERRFIRAEAYLMLQAPDRALVVLEGMTDTRSRSLRAQAFAALGDHAAALTAAREDQGTPQQAALQFRAGAWEALGLQDDPVMSTLAQVVTEPTPEAAQTLSDRRQILEASQRSRAAITDMLNRFDVPATTE